MALPTPLIHFSASFERENRAFLVRFAKSAAMSAPTEAAVMAFAHGLGVVGIAGVWQVPFRLFSIVLWCRNGNSLKSEVRSPVRVAPLLAAVALSLYVACNTLPQTFHCLAGEPCGLVRASGLIGLAVFGLSVVLVEAIWMVSKPLAGVKI